MPEILGDKLATESPARDLAAEFLCRRGSVEIGFRAGLVCAEQFTGPLYLGLLYVYYVPFDGCVCKSIRAGLLPVLIC